MAYQGHIVVPTTHERASHVIDTICAGMAIRFGGYSIYEGSGGWATDDDVVEEDHVRIVTDVVLEDNDYIDTKGQFVEWLKTEATYTKGIIEDDAVLVEVHEPEVYFI